MPKIPEETTKLSPFWATADGKSVKLYLGNVIDVLRKLPENSVHMCVTSPPYWRLRDYGTGSWEGGDPKCDHVEGYTRGVASGGKNDALNSPGVPAVKLAAALCKKCGATRIDHQLGSEASSDCLGWAKGENCAEQDWGSACHVCRMVLVLRELRRVLRDDGTLWMNYGDSYSSGTTAPSKSSKAGSVAGRWNKESDSIGASRVNVKGLPAGNLVGVPWRVALAMQADGWILRQDIIWSKPSPMPESVRNRCTKAHEYVFLFSKKKEYFYDAEAIKVPMSPKASEASRLRTEVGRTSKGDAARSEMANSKQVATTGRIAKETIREAYAPTAANKRSVWTIASRGYEGAHFATFSEELIIPTIKAGSSEKGCCAKCGSPWRRVVSDGTGGAIGRARLDHSRDDEAGNFKTVPSNGYQPGKTVGFEPSCECHGKFVKKKKKVTGYVFERVVSVYVPSIPLEDHPIVPCTVLDPFMGSGTTAAVSLSLGRNSVGIDLSQVYLENNAIPRITGEILKRPELGKLISHDVKKVAVGVSVKKS